MKPFKIFVLIFLQILLAASCKRHGSTNATVASDHKDSTSLAPKGLTRDTGLADFDPALKFQDFEAKPYRGKLAAPNFDKSAYKNDKEFVKFITEGCLENKVNFSGHYTIIEKSCGAMCQFIFIVDRIDGRIVEGWSLNDSRMKSDGKIGDGRFGYLYRPDSHILMANTGAFTDSTMTHYRVESGIPEIYVWVDDKEFIKLK